MNGRFDEPIAGTKMQWVCFDHVMFMTPADDDMLHTPSLSVVIDQ